MPHTNATDAATPLVRSFLRRYRNEILAEWRAAARSRIPAAQDLAPIALVDHIPELLDEVADIAEEIRANDGSVGPFETARRHALDRLRDGFGISAVVKELSLLRGCMLRVWEREHHGGSITDLRTLDLAIDAAIETSVTRYAEARERALSGVDRISMATLESSSVDDLLRRLLTVFKDTTPAVDTAAILLAEGNVLRMRAVVGLDEHEQDTLDVAIGEGFSGTIAERRRPMELRSACTDPLVKSRAIRERGVRALYGVPLIHDDRVIGVAHMGSFTANEFSQDDRQFFDSLIARATVGIVHQQLRHELAESQRRFERLAAERERALAKLECLLSASPVGIAFVDRDLRYISINDALASINGRPAAEHIGRTLTEVLPDLAGHLEGLLRTVLDTGEPVLNLEVTRQGATADDTRWLLANYFPVRSETGSILGVGGVVLDVTDARRAEEALRLEQTRLRSILDHAPAAIWIKDIEGRIILANNQLADALGQERDKLLGKRSDEILPDDVARQHQEHDAIVLRENRAIEVEEVASAEQGARTFLSIKFPIPGNPRLVGAIATEITDRKRMEADLRDAVRMREDLLAVVSHDLRSPLSTAQLSASLLMSLLGSDHRARRHVEMINRSCTRMESLIDALLDMARIRAGRFQLDVEDEQVSEVVSEALDLQQPIAAEKNIRLVLVAQVADERIKCDRGRILQVFENLIGNAIKFCRAGDTITLSCEREGDDIRFCVQDTGPGIAAELLPQLFEPYRSGPGHGTQGAGLGLFIVRGIVESHGGHAWADSAPGGGARFFFTLPMSR